MPRDSMPSPEQLGEDVRAAVASALENQRQQFQSPITGPMWSILEAVLVEVLTSVLAKHGK
jgi:hypothetical protein